MIDDILPKRAWLLLAIAAGLLACSRRPIPHPVIDILSDGSVTRWGERHVRRTWIFADSVSMARAHDSLELHLADTGAQPVMCPARLNGVRAGVGAAYAAINEPLKVWRLPDSDAVLSDDPGIGGGPWTVNLDLYRSNTLFCLRSVPN